jgi:cardiolipin synthase A/B
VAFSDYLGNHPVLSHLFTVGGFLLAFFLIARLLTEKRQPGNTVAWLLIIVLVPYVGVPLYLLLGGRKLQRLVARKSRLLPTVEGLETVDIASQLTPTAQTVNASGASPPVGGNTVRLLTTGEDAFAALENHIRGAQKSIHITTFILGRDEVGRRLVNLLAERARAGIKVRLLLDAVGCMFSSRGFVQPIRDAGGEVHRFMPVLPVVFRKTANLRNHRKIAVFDQHTAIVGGQNLAREYIGPTPFKKRFRDFGAVIAGPAAALLNEVLLADWSFASGQRLDQLHKESAPEAIRAEGHSALQVVASGPDVGGDPLYEGILSMIQEARERIWIITPYFIPDEVLWRSLMVKARAGTEVTLILPARSNHPITDYARRHYTRELRTAGARSR